jgi:hypothetical protein
LEISSSRIELVINKKKEMLLFLHAVNGRQRGERKLSKLGLGALWNNTGNETVLVVMIALCF